MGNYIFSNTLLVLASSHNLPVFNLPSQKDRLLLLAPDLLLMSASERLITCLYVCIMVASYSSTIRKHCSYLHLLSLFYLYYLIIYFLLLLHSITGNSPIYRGNTGLHDRDDHFLEHWYAIHRNC